MKAPQHPPEERRLPHHTLAGRFSCPGHGFPTSVALHGVRRYCGDRIASSADCRVCTPKIKAFLSLCREFTPEAVDMGVTED